LSSVTIGTLELPSLHTLSDAALAQGYQVQPDGLVAPELATPKSTSAFFTEGVTLQDPSKMLQLSAISPVPLDGASGSIDERQFWQAPESVQLKGHEFDMFRRYVSLEDATHI